MGPQTRFASAQPSADRVPHVPHVFLEADQQVGPVEEADLLGLKPRRKGGTPLPLRQRRGLGRVGVGPKVLISADAFLTGFLHGRPLPQSKRRMAQRQHAGDDEQLVVERIELRALGHVQHVLGGQGVQPEGLHDAMDDVGVQPVNVDPSHGHPFRSRRGQEALQIQDLHYLHLLPAVVDALDFHGPRRRGGVHIRHRFDAGMGARRRPRHPPLAPPQSRQPQRPQHRPTDLPDRADGRVDRPADHPAQRRRHPVGLKHRTSPAADRPASPPVA